MTLLCLFCNTGERVIFARRSGDIEIVNRRCNRTMPSWRCNFSLRHPRHRGYAGRAAPLLASFIIAPCAKRTRRQSSTATAKLGRAFPPVRVLFLRWSLISPAWRPRKVSARRTNEHVSATSTQTCRRESFDEADWLHFSVGAVVLHRAK